MFSLSLSLSLSLSQSLDSQIDSQESPGLAKRCNLLRRAYPHSEYELRIIAPQVSEIAQVISFSPHILVRDAFQLILQTERFCRLATSTTDQFRMFLPSRQQENVGVWMSPDLFLWHYDLSDGVRVLQHSTAVCLGSF